MNYKFLDKVLDQIVSETRIDHDNWEVSYPFYNITIFFGIAIKIHNKKWGIINSNSIPLSKFFYNHCKSVYGLNEDEVKYVWDEYGNIIKDMLPY